VHSDVPALRRAQLSWVNQNFIRNETLPEANACLVAAQNRIPLVQAWGGGEVASADGLRFVVPVRTLHAGPNPKYFGYEHGVTYYNLVSDQFTGLNAVVIPGTLRDNLFLLAVVLEQETEIHPTEIMTDTGAYTDVIFGLFWLLGYRFSPRIADIGGARYWRIDAAADYGCLNGVAPHRINTNLIKDNWDDALRLAGSLKLGVVQATSIMRTLRIDDRPTKLAQAVAELGRIDKTIHCLTYIDDESKRRRTLTQLNRQEDRHKLARAVFQIACGRFGASACGDVDRASFREITVLPQLVVHRPSFRTKKPLSQRISLPFIDLDRADRLLPSHKSRDCPRYLWRRPQSCMFDRPGRRPFVLQAMVLGTSTYLRQDSKQRCHSAGIGRTHRLPRSYRRQCWTFQV
jgi:TnpA family transposase